VTQLIAYLEEGRRALGVIPTQQTLVLERFFDESGGMQLVLHAPFGSRINKAWALALRKRFCRQFNFELQAAATEDALMLSLGPAALLSAVRCVPLPASRNDARRAGPGVSRRAGLRNALALERDGLARGAAPPRRSEVAPQLQRMLAADLLASVFPDAAACLENIPGDREIPDHPLVSQTVRDCLDEAMDFEGLRRVLERIHRGELQLVARDTPEPSVFAYEILDARPYAFLDDAPARGAAEPRGADARGAEAPDDLGALDAGAIARVRDEARPDPRDADELHDALMTAGFLTPDEIARSRASRSADDARPRRRHTARRRRRRASARAARGTSGDRARSADRARRRRARATWRRDAAIVELLRGRLTLVGPTTAERSPLAADRGARSGGRAPCPRE
jgi:ATP-dependent Lhr-like helicase